MNKRYDILVVGEINPDLILQGNAHPTFGQVEKRVNEAILTVGSSSAIFACAASRLGLRVDFVGKCGDDVFGHFMIAEMERRGVDTSHIVRTPHLRTGLSVILSEGADRAILTFTGAMTALSTEEIHEDRLLQATHLHVSSYFLQDALRPGLPRLFKRAREMGLTVSLDTNYDPSERWEGVRSLLPLVNVFLPNVQEACALTGKEDPVEAAKTLVEWGAEFVVVKMGTQGALGIHEGKLEAVPALKVETVDTTGAGDNFDAGFIYGFLKRWNLRDSLKLGAVCGALSTRAIGGVEAQVTLEEARSFLEQL